jgi:hypothetical protein
VRSLAVEGAQWQISTALPVANCSGWVRIQALGYAVGVGVGDAEGAGRDGGIARQLLHRWGIGKGKGSQDQRVVVCRVGAGHSRHGVTLAASGWRSLASSLPPR